MQTGYPHPLRRDRTRCGSCRKGAARRPQPGLVSTIMWYTDGAPAAIPIGERLEDMGAGILGTSPPRSGTRFAVIDFPPGNQPHMHRTETIDYVIVMEGEIEIDMDASTTS
jgi:naringenin degradation protein FdeH